MCRRSQEPALGQWIIPSGFLECGETLEEGAARETLEETGVVIDPARLELSSVMNMTIVDQVAITFRTEVDTRPELVPGAECLEVAFMTEHDIPPAEFAWREAMGTLPPRVFGELRSREYSIRLVSIATAHGAGFKSRRYKIQSTAGEDGP
jgi:ADP-ribose pyrophosphatase YjhB (NUDIX family)